MVTTKFEAKPAIVGLYTENDVYVSRHTHSTVEITLEYVTDTELTSLYRQFLVKEDGKNE